MTKDHAKVEDGSILAVFAPVALPQARMLLLISFHQCVWLYSGRLWHSNDAKVLEKHLTDSVGLASLGV